MGKELYNWQQADWPEFRYDITGLQDIFWAFAEKTGHVSGILKTLPENLQTETIIDLMIDEAIKTSAIEGEYFSREAIRSSIRNNMGLNVPLQSVRDKRAKGAADLMVRVRQDFTRPLSETILFDWHKALMQGHQGSHLIIGDWRQGEEPMQIVSGPIGKYQVHFEAPPSSRVPDEMARFIAWFNATAPGSAKEIKMAPVRAAIVHLYFETIHPFDDGNGRIGRALADKALSQGLGRPVLLSLSKTIEAQRKDYYQALKSAQRSNEMTEWITWFVQMILEAQIDAEQLIEFTLAKAKFFTKFKDQLNERQLKIVRQLLEKNPDGSLGSIKASKYAAITQTSKPTATRDLQYLTEIGALISTGGGRSTRYKANVN